MKLRKRISKNHIPSLFTLINMFLGFLAILSIVEGYYIRGAYLIIAASVFDVLDGKLARKLYGGSDFGSELDSLADLVSFCLAPAVLIWTLYARDLHPILGALIAGAPLYFGALRLARFNVGQQTSPLSYYEGLPTPINAVTVVAMVFYYEAQGHSGAAKVVLPVAVALAFLMVSHIRYAKFPNFTFHGGLLNSLKVLFAFALLAALPIFGGRILLPIAILYVLQGLLRWLTRLDTGADLPQRDVPQESLSGTFGQLTEKKV